MLDADSASRYQSYYGGQNVAGQSPKDEIHNELQNFAVQNSKALNKMRAAVLRSQAEECYPEKWMSQDFSNAEQIAICKEEVNERIMGALNREYTNVRRSADFRFQDCEVAAGNNVLKFVHCIQNLKKEVSADNQKLGLWLKSNCSEYL